MRTYVRTESRWSSFRRAKRGQNMRVDSVFDMYQTTVNADPDQVTEARRRRDLLQDGVRGRRRCRGGQGVWFAGTWDTEGPDP